MSGDADINDLVGKWRASAKMGDTMAWRWTYNGSPRAIVRGRAAGTADLWEGRAIWRYLTPGRTTVLLPKTTLLTGLVCATVAYGRICARAQRNADDTWDLMQRRNGELWGHIHMMRKEATKIGSAISGDGSIDRAYIKRKLGRIQTRLD